MANPNIVVDDEGNRAFDDNGHLVLARALGINRFQQSANGAFLLSPNGARTRKDAPYYIPASHAGYSVLEYLPANDYLTPIRGFSAIINTTLQTAKQDIEVSRPSFPGGPYYSYGVGHGRYGGLDYSSRLGISFPLEASYAGGTTFEVVFDRPLKQYASDIGSAPALIVSTTDDHSGYSSSVAKTTWTWETKTGYQHTFVLGTSRLLMPGTISPLFGSYLSVILRCTYGNEPDKLTSFPLQPRYDFFAGDTYRDVAAMIPRLLVTPP